MWTGHRPRVLEVVAHAGLTGEMKLTKEMSGEGAMPMLLADGRGGGGGAGPVTPHQLEGTL